MKGIGNEELLDLMVSVEETLDNCDNYTVAVVCINSALTALREMENRQEKNKLVDWLIGRLLIEFSMLKNS